MRQGTAMALTAGLVLGAAVTLAAASLGPGLPPGGEAVAGERSVPLIRGTYCWQSRWGTAGRCEEYDLLAADPPLDIIRGQVVRLELDRSPLGGSAAFIPVKMDDAEPFGADALAWRAERIDLVAASRIRLTAERLRVEVDEPAGLYLLHIHVDFDRGDASYGVLIDVRE